MQPTKASHSILPPRPVTAPAAAGYPPPAPVGHRLVHRGSRAAPVLDAAAVEQQLPVTVAAIATPSRRSCSVTPLGAEAAQTAGVWEPSLMATPKNSDRPGLMIPRSSRSVRNEVLQSRGPDEAGAGRPEQAVPGAAAGVVPGTPSRGGRPATPLAVEVGDEPSGGHRAELATPKHSDRRGSGNMRVMLPRSSRSIRNNVLQARGTEETDIVPDLTQQPVPPSGPTTPAGRRKAPVPVLGEDVMGGAASNWSCGPMATPKNGERRDMTASVQLMTPLWRGSGITPMGAEVSRAAATKEHGPMVSPTGMVQVVRPGSSQGMHAATPEPAAQPVVVAQPTTVPLNPAPPQQAAPAVHATRVAQPGTPARRSPTPLGAEVTTGTATTWMAVGTPKNSDRVDLNGSVQLNAPLWRGSAGTPLAAAMVHAAAS
mmetsp:Transcript_18202/g.57844  ORF Transcript_18202/g.57844 Transcript_18202/m.57844 type:complete len:428 (-) Transcript_18202:146-1429(-)